MPLNLVYIRQRREQLYPSQLHAGLAAGFAPKYARQRWNDIEHARRPSPTLPTLQALARALRCKMESLTTRD